MTLWKLQWLWKRTICLLFGHYTPERGGARERFCPQCGARVRKWK